jgi:hypothetical protein
MKQIKLTKTDIAAQQKHVGTVFNIEDTFYEQSQAHPRRYFEAISQTIYFTIRVRASDYELIEVEED